MRKPKEIIKTLYITSHVDLKPYHDELKELGVKYTTKTIFSNFYGTQFTIQQPTGRGAWTKTQKVHDVFELWKKR